MASLPAPSNQSVDAFLCLVDALDAEANAVTHAVVRAQATVQSIVDDARTLLDTPQIDEHAWAEVGVRLMQHRAVLVDALAGLCRAGSDHPANGPPPVTAVSTATPPQSIPEDEGPADDEIAIPQPPRARLRPPRAPSRDPADLVLVASRSGPYRSADNG